MNQQTRRSFLKSTAVTAAALGVPAVSWGRVLGANDDLRVAVVGFNGRGKDHIDGFRKVKGVRLVALCDCDSEVLNREAARLATEGNPVEKFADVRKLIESEQVDAISIATPNHWHSLMSIWAIQAGKDVYCEKPVSHNVWEGRQLVNAARKHERIVQAGTQSRSSPGLKEAIAWLQAGNLGKIKLARGLCYKPRQTIGKVAGDQAPPASVDYDMWCGPAPKVPLHRQKLHYDWHWVFDTGNGDLGNQGIHQMDIARWALGEAGLSPNVFSVGGRLGYDDDGNTPNSQFVYHAYANAPLIFEVRGLPKGKEFQDARWTKSMDNYRGAGIGVAVDCEGGTLVIPNYTGATAFDKSGKEIQKWNKGADHYENFAAAVRSRKHTDLNADIEQGHVSSALCHTGNISYQLGEKLGPEAIKDRLKDNPAAGETFGRLAEHLAANGVDLNTQKVTLGAMLKMDPKSETFLNNPKASRMLTREYRKPYEVPAVKALAKA